MLYENVFFVQSSYRMMVDKRTGLSVQVPDPSGASVQPFYPNFEQHTKIMYRWRCLKEGRPFSSITVKKRAVGESLICSLIIMAENLFRQNGSINTIASDPGNRGVMYNDVIRTPLENLPREILPELSNRFLPNNSPVGIRFTSPANQKTGYAGGSFNWRLISAELGKKAGLGSRAMHNHYTEFAKWSNDVAVMQGLQSTIMDSPHSFLAIESTAEGRGNQHYERVMSAWREQGSCNWWEPGFNSQSNAQQTAFFYPWWYSEQCRVKLVEGVRPFELYNDMTDYERRVYLECLEPRARNFVGLTGDDVMAYTMEQIHWFRCYCSNLYGMDRDIRLGKISIDPAPTEEIRKSEYPTYIEEAFVDNVSSYIPDNVVSRLRERAEDPTVVGVLDEGGCFTEDPSGWLKLWYPKSQIEPNGKLRNPNLVSLGIDVAHGTHPHNEKHDLSAIVGLGVFDFRQYCEVNVRIPVPHFEAYIWRLCKFLSGGYYANFPIICAESADAGLPLVQRLAEEYPDKDHPDPLKIYFSQSVERINMPDRPTPGFNPKIAALERLAWSTLRNSLLNEETWPKSKLVIDQLENLIQHANGKVEAKKKGRGGKASKDDVAEALKMAVHHIVSISQKVPIDSAFPEHTKEGMVAKASSGRWIGPVSPEEWEERRQREWRDRKMIWHRGGPPPEFMPYPGTVLESA